MILYTYKNRTNKNTGNFFSFPDTSINPIFGFDKPHLLSREGVRLQTSRLRQFFFYIRLKPHPAYLWNRLLRARYEKDE